MGVLNNSGSTVKVLVVTAALFIVLAGIKVSANILVPFLLAAFTSAAKLIYCHFLTFILGCTYFLFQLLPCELGLRNVKAAVSSY